MLVPIFQAVRRHFLNKRNLDVAAIRAWSFTVLLITSKVDICLNVPQQGFLVPSCRTVLNVKRRWCMCGNGMLQPLYQRPMS